MKTGEITARKMRASWLFPTLHGYRREWIAADAIAGISAGAVVIPQAMAYATIANLPVQVGLYTCMVPMLVYAALGGSRAMSVSTTSTVATLTATTFVSAGIASASPNPTGALVTLALLVGVILVLARLLKLGALVENINQATLIGIKVGLGATVALGQVPKLLGVDVEVTGHGFIRTLNATIEAIPRANLATVVLSIATILVLFLVARFVPRIPGPLLVVVAGIVLAAFTGIHALGVRLIDTVPTGLPVPALPDLGPTVSLLPGAFAIAIMVFLESASVARGIREPSDPQIDSNRELLAAGAVNVIGSFFRSLPAAGGFSQSAVNLRAGAKSQGAALVTVALAVLVALLLAPLISLLPQATLAAMVFVAVFSLIDVRGMARLARINPIEFWIAAVTAAIGLAAGLIAAVVAGVVFTLILVLRELNKPRIAASRPASGVLLVELKSPLYTANVLGTVSAVQSAVAEADSAADAGDAPLRVVVLDASILQVTSVTVLDALAGLDRELAARDLRLDLAELPERSLVLARKTSWGSGLEADGRIHDTVADALARGL
jgi:MFS superfamily sulfate permease-like transporter